MAQPEHRNQPAWRISAATKTRPLRRPAFADPLTYIYAVLALLAVGLGEMALTNVLRQLHLL